MSETWLGLMIGNSRLHWGLFAGKTLTHTWDSNYIPSNTILLKQISFPFPIDSSYLPLVLASVVPSQTEIWQNYPGDVRVITLEQIPLQNMYSTLGIDRALALYGAGKKIGFPIMVIDAGTALTFSCADDNLSFRGGVILPGLGLQLSTLANRTGQLPKVELFNKLPSRFAMNTSFAVQSGVIYTLLAGIKDFIEAWWQDFPQAKVVMTGGDSIILHSYLQSHDPEIASHVLLEGDLIFWGMREIR